MVNRFGSQSEMVIQPVEENGTSYLLAIDEKGLYLTTKTYVDSNMADPNRFSDRGGIIPRLQALNLDPQAILQANQHRIPKIGEGDAKKKVNPLKASKRSMKK